MGFVLFFWALLLGGAAVVCAVVLGLWSWWHQRRTFGRGGIVTTVAAAAFPFLLLGYAGAAFAGYAIWCETVRDVDPGLGDGWRVPVGNDHYFCMIDVPDDGYLLKGGCSGAPVVHGITALAAAGDLVFGSSESNGPFVLDTRTGAVQTFASVDAAVAQMTTPPILQTAADFYADRRWGRADVIAAVLIGVPVAVAAIFWVLVVHSSASRATRGRADHAAPSVSGSVGSTPNNWARTTRAVARAAQMPKASNRIAMIGHRSSGGPAFLAASISASSRAICSRIFRTLRRSSAFPRLLNSGSSLTL